MIIKNIANDNRIIWDRTGVSHELKPSEHRDLDVKTYDKRIFEEINSRKVETGAEKPRKNKMEDKK